jgi:hypothetical protein
MTAKELKSKFIKDFGFKEWPETYEVDAETYGYVCQAIFDNWIERDFPPEFASVRLGFQGGILFQNVELLIKKEES